MNIIQPVNKFEFLFATNSNTTTMLQNQKQSFLIPSESSCPLKTMATTKPRPHWPFLFYQEDGKMYHNPIKQRSAYEEASDAGEALL